MMESPSLPSPPSSTDTPLEPAVKPAEPAKKRLHSVVAISNLLNDDEPQDTAVSSSGDMEDSASDDGKDDADMERLNKLAAARSASLSSADRKEAERTFIADWKPTLPDWIEKDLFLSILDTPSSSSEGKSSLQLWFLVHLDNPYPTDEERRKLESLSRIADSQSALWFSNTRRRNKNLLLINSGQIQVLQVWFLHHLNKGVPNDVELVELEKKTGLSQATILDWMREARNLFRRFCPTFLASGLLSRTEAQPRWLSAGFERPPRGAQQLLGALTESPGAPRASRALPKATIRMLNEWFDAHIHHPYPNTEEQTQLVQKTGLSETQVLNWLANARRRSVKAQRAEVTNWAPRTNRPISSPAMQRVMPPLSQQTMHPMMYGSSPPTTVGSYPMFQMQQQQQQHQHQGPPQSYYYPHQQYMMAPPSQLQPQQIPQPQQYQGLRHSVLMESAFKRHHPSL